MSETRAVLSCRIDELEARLPFLKFRHSNASRLLFEVSVFADALLEKADFNDQVWAFAEVNSMLERHAIAPLDHAD